MSYIQIAESNVPATVRFDVPARNRGQTIEIAYGGFSRGEHGPGDPYRSVLDRSTGRTTYYHLADAPTLRLRLITDGDARRLMMSASAAGGWIAVGDSARIAVQRAGSDCLLALLPSSWGDGIPATADLVTRVIAVYEGWLGIEEIDTPELRAELARLRGALEAA